jgi:hypothetical protein
MFCEICQRKFNSSNSFYRHRTWSQVHLLKEQILLYEAEIRELQKINPPIKDPLNQPFYSSHNTIQKSPIPDLMKADTWYWYRNKFWIPYMKYSMYLKQYVCKSPYPYYIIHADEWLTKFEVWSNRKTINAWLYTEEEVIAMIEAKYPGAQRIPRVHRNRPTKVNTPRRNPYPAKQ